MSQMKKIPFNISGVYSSWVHDKLMDYGTSTPDEGGMSWEPSTHFSLPCFDLKKSPNEQSNDPQMSREEYNKNHVQPTPKPSTVQLTHIKAKQSNQSIKTRYYDKVEMDF